MIHGPEVKQTDTTNIYRIRIKKAKSTSIWRPPERLRIKRAKSPPSSSMWRLPERLRIKRPNSTNIWRLTERFRI